MLPVNLLYPQLFKFKMLSFLFGKVMHSDFELLLFVSASNSLISDVFCIQGISIWTNVLTFQILTLFWCWKTKMHAQIHLESLPEISQVKKSPEMNVSEHDLNSLKIWAHNSQKQKSYGIFKNLSFFSKKNSDLTPGMNLTFKQFFITLPELGAKNSPDQLMFLKVSDKYTKQAILPVTTRCKIPLPQKLSW